MPDSAHDVTQELLDWAREAAPDVPVAARGSADPVADGIEIRLLNLTPKAAPRMVAPPAVLALDYLVAVRRKDALEEHRVAAELMFAALTRPELEIVAEGSTTAASARLGLPAATGFVVRTHLTRAPKVERAPLVRFPLVAELTGVGRVEGMVLGPADTPIGGATVTLVGLGRTTRTGPDGRFRIAGPLPDTVKVRVNARAGGVEAEVTTAAGEPAILILPLET